MQWGRQHVPRLQRVTGAAALRTQTMNDPNAAKPRDEARTVPAGRPGVFRHGIPVVGIIGGIGSGKSSVAKWVAAHAPVRVIDADALGHEALLEPHVVEALREKFGSEILGADGRISRPALAKKVFGSTPDHLNARHELERVVHPEIRRKAVAEFGRAAASGMAAVLLDAAILLEAGWNQECDLVVYVHTPDEIRLQRVRDNRGWTADELHRREASQWSLDRKQRGADFTVLNDSDLDHAGRQLLAELCQRGYIN